MTEKQSFVFSFSFKEDGGGALRDLRDEHAEDGAAHR